MSNSTLAEIYFVAGMMIVVLVICGVATYFFFKTFYAEKRGAQANLKSGKPQKKDD